MSETSGWRGIEDAPLDQEILVYTRPWGPIIALHSEEFGQWLSRMQVPVSIKEDHELPTHWQPLPAPPEGLDASTPGTPMGAGSERQEAADTY